jgi:hypothetical protein
MKDVTAHDPDNDRLRVEWQAGIDPGRYRLAKQSSIHTLRQAILSVTAGGGQRY